MKNKNSSGDEIANVNFYAITILGYPSCAEGFPGAISVTFSADVNGWPRYLMP